MTQTRWPRGTPVAPSGRGPGGGRFRSSGTDWASIVSGRVQRIRTSPRLADSIASGAAPDWEELEGGHSDASVMLESYNDGTKGVRKNYDYNWQGLSPKWQADAEQAASILGRAIGVQVPEVVRSAPDETVARYVEGEVGGWWMRDEVRRRVQARQGGYSEMERALDKEFRAENKAGLHPDRVRLGLFDQLIENSDRTNSGNWVMQADGTIGGIDHASTFRAVGVEDPAIPSLSGAAGPFATPFVMGFEDPKWKTNPLTKADVAWLRQQVDSVRPEFERLGRLDWWEFVSVRLDAIGAKARGKENIFVGVVDV